MPVAVAIELVETIAFNCFATIIAPLPPPHSRKIIQQESEGGDAFISHWENWWLPLWYNIYTHSIWIYHSTIVCYIRDRSRSRDWHKKLLLQSVSSPDADDADADDHPEDDANSGIHSWTFMCVRLIISIACMQTYCICMYIYVYTCNPAAKSISQQQHALIIMKMRVCGGALFFCNACFQRECVCMFLRAHQRRVQRARACVVCVLGVL